MNCDGAACYSLMTAKMDYYDARATCQSVVADVSVISNKQEESFIYDSVLPSTVYSIWNGYTDEKEESVFVDNNNKPATYIGTFLFIPIGSSCGRADCVMDSHTTGPGIKTGWYGIYTEILTGYHHTST